jgi:hypothetical protein
VEQLEIDQTCGILEIDQGILESGVWSLENQGILESGVGRIYWSLENLKTKSYIIPKRFSNFLRNRKT